MPIRPSMLIIKLHPWQAEFSFRKSNFCQNLLTFLEVAMTIIPHMQKRIENR